MEVKSEVWTHLAWKGRVWTCQRERRNSRMVEKAPRLDYIYYSISAFSAWWLSWLKVCKLKNILIEFLNFQTLLYCQNNVKDISFLPCQSRQKNKIKLSENLKIVVFTTSHQPLILSLQIVSISVHPLYRWKCLLWAVSKLQGV